MVRWSARAVRGLAGFALAVVVVLAVLAIGSAWRLAQGPLDVTPIARRVLPRYAPGIEVSGVMLDWQAFDGGPRALHVVASDLRVGAALSARQASVALSMSLLLQGEVMPTDVEIEGLRLRLARSAEGLVSLDGELPVPTGSGGDRDDTVASALATLRHVALKDASVTLTEADTGRIATVGNLNADFARRPDGGIGGKAAAELTVDDMTVQANVTAQQDAGSITRLRADLWPVSPASLAHLHPSLAPLAMVDAPMTLHAQAELSPNWSLRHAAVQALLGPGVALLPAKGGGTSPGRFESIALDAEGDLAAVTIRSLHLVLRPRAATLPTNIQASGTVSRRGSGMRADVTVDLDRVALADVPVLWPVDTGGGARVWITENLVAGTAHDGHFTLGLETPGSLADLDLVQAGGTLAADDVTMYWLRPLPPVEHAQALLTLENPDTLGVVFNGARVGRILERAGNVHITGMMTPHQIGVVNTDLAAPVADVIRLLSHPKLEILSTHPLPLTNARGDVAVHLVVSIPLEDKIEFDDVAIHAAAQISRLHFTFAPGRDLDGGSVAMDVSSAGLKARGTALLVGIPSTLAVDMDFRNGPATQVMQQVVVTLRADERQLAQAGLDTHKLLEGPVTVKVDYVEQRSGQASVQMHADIGQTAVQTPLGWSKPVGAAGFVDVRAHLLQGRLIGIDHLQAEAPDLSIEAHSRVESGRESVLHIDRAVIGRTRVSGKIELGATPSDPVRIQLSGPVLDLTGLLDARSAQGLGMVDAPVARDAGRDAGQPFALDLRFGQVTARKAAIGPVTLVVEGSTTHVARAHLTSSGPEDLHASLVPNGAGRHLDIRAGDLGRLLTAVEVTTTLAGGQLKLGGDFDDDRVAPSFHGSAELQDFRIRGAPILGKILQALTLYGLVDALRGPGLVFDHFTSKFRLTGSRLEIMDARAFSSSLGLTATGEVDPVRNTIAMEGTVIPAYLLNTLLGRVPLLGRLFSPEEGGGVFAATFGVHGSLDAPRIGFNPLALLTPGVLRKVFRLFR